MCLYRRPRSKYWWATWVAPDGTRVQRSTRCTDKAAAQRVAQRWRVEEERSWAAGDPPAEETLTISLAELAEHFLETASAVLSPRYVSGLRLTINRYILPEFGRTTIARTVTRNQVETWRRRLTLGEIASEGMRLRDDGRLSASTVNRVVSALRRLCNHAVRHRFMRSDPSQKLPVIKERPEERYRALASHEVEALAEALSHTRRAASHVAWLRFAVATGLRADEIASLRWDQIGDLPGTKTRKAITLAADQTKGGRRRIVPLVQDALTQLAAVPPRTDGLVFGPANRRTALERAWKATELPGRTPSAHDLRNTAASRAVAAGFDLAELMEWFGWTNPKTAQQYIHMYGGRWDSMARKMESSPAE